MTDPNLHSPGWEADFRETPVRSQALRVGAAAGSRELGEFMELFQRAIALDAEHDRREHPPS